jgi:hypothetical protein
LVKNRELGGFQSQARVTLLHATARPQARRAMAEPIFF